MTPTKIKCPICGKKMSLGSRVQITLGWEYSAGKRIKSAIICRECADKIANVTGMEVPNV